MINGTQHMIETTNGVAISAWDFWAADDETHPTRTIVFCHATGFHARVWDPIITTLLADSPDENLRCIAVDLRGHGDSVLPEGAGVAWLDIADDLLRVLDHFDLGTDEPVHAVGHSLGGGTIFLAEHRRPGTFASAWLFEPIAIPTTTGQHKSVLSISARKRREIFDSHDAVFERYTSRPPFDSCEPGTIRRYVDYGFRPHADGGVILKCRGEIEAQVYDGTLTPLTYEKLPEIDQLRATIVGSGDGGIPAVLSAQIADALPHGTHEVAETLTHFGPFQDTAAMAASIRASL